MKNNVLIGIFLGSMLFGLIGGARATVLNFDDLNVNVQYGFVQISNGYNSFNWFNMNASYKYYHGYSGTGYYTGVVSESNAAFNSAGLDSYITSIGTDFDFNGAWFTAAWIEDLPLTIKAYDSGVLIDTASIILSRSTPKWLDFNVSNIDRLYFTTINAQSGQFVMDNFTFNEAVITPNQNTVPEPSTFLLLGVGLAGLFGLRRFKR